MKNANDIIGVFLPSIEQWLRGVVADEVQKAIAQENERKKPVRTYTRQEVAKMAKISLPTLWDKVRKGKIKPLPKTGRRVIFSEDEVKKFLEG